MTKINDITKLLMYLEGLQGRFSTGRSAQLDILMDKAQTEVKRLVKITKGITWSEFMWNELSKGNITEEEYFTEVDSD